MRCAAFQLFYGTPKRGRARERKSGSQQTPRWRKADSNCWSPYRWDRVAARCYGFLWPNNRTAPLLVYQPKCEKIIRLHSQTAVIENGFVHIPETAPWLAEYLHEMTVFPSSKHDDQADSTAQFLDWFQRPFPSQGFFELMRRQAEAAEQHRKPQPIQTTWAIGSMEWLAEQKKSR